MKKVIPDFPDYSVTIDGKVWSRLTSRWLKSFADSRGYLKVNLCRDTKVYQRPVHRLVLEAHIGPCPDGMECCHSDGNPVNNNLSNLRWDTRSNNILDAVKHGTHVDNRGEKQGASKLTTDQVLAIRREYPSKGTQQAIGARYGVCSQMISRIVNRIDWRHI